ncbi:MAG: isoprenylcysteine carboxylmethyltransferase family protein [bacterium]
MPFLKTLIVTIVVQGTVTVVVPFLLLSSGLNLFAVRFGNFRLLGLLPLAAGILIYLWCAWGFAFVGRGTPLPVDPPKTLVVRGLYRYIRNPMYVGIFLILIGESVFFESALLFIYSVLVLTAFNLFVFFYEEPVLTKKFGDSYTQYCRRVPRWIPRFLESNNGDANGKEQR